MSQVFEGYERQYCELSANLSRKCTAASLLNGGKINTENLSWFFAFFFAVVLDILDGFFFHLSYVGNLILCSCDNAFRFLVLSVDLFGDWERMKKNVLAPTNESPCLGLESQSYCIVQKKKKKAR